MGSGPTGGTGDKPHFMLARQVVELINDAINIVNGKVSRMVPSGGSNSVVLHRHTPAPRGGDGESPGT